MYKTVGSARHEWAGMTHPELKDIAEQDGSIFILPVGSLEQHGHHMPTITDSVLVDAVSNLGVERVRETVPVVTAPPLWAGISPHHLNIGATISLEFDTMLNIIEDIADSVIDNGFDAFLLLNGHGGNNSLVTAATQKIGPKYPETQVLANTYWTLIADKIEQIRDSELGGISHGGEFETSLMMYLRPELVQKEKIEVNYHEKSYKQARGDLFDPGNLSVYKPSSYHTNTGVDGDPSLAGAKKGQKIHKLIGEAVGSLLVEIHEESI